MYSSFNKFDHNVYRDATIVTTLDTFTSLLAGVTIFGILGHLAHEIGTDNIGDVVNPGAGLAFISYPDAIARFEFLPQVNFIADNKLSELCGHRNQRHQMISSLSIGFLGALLLHVICTGHWQ